MANRTALFLAFSVATSVVYAEPKLPKEVVYHLHELRPNETVKNWQEVEDKNRLYDKVFVSSLSVCATSSWKKRNDSNGGNFGHAIAMIRGACIDRDAAGLPKIPLQLKLCPGQTVGLSTDAQLHNLHWMAVDGREFMLYGGHNPVLPFDEAAFQASMAESIRRKIYHGVEFKPWNATEERKKGGTEEEIHMAVVKNWAADFTHGTDYALATARGVTCTRIPLVGSKPGKADAPLRRLVEHFNKQNQKAFYDSKHAKPGQKEPIGYDYDSMVNNCAHTIDTALSALGFWPMKNTSGHPTAIQDRLLRRADLSAPYNMTFEAFTTASDPNLDRLVQRLRESKEDFGFFKEAGWLPFQPGTIMEDILPATYLNSVYDPKVDRAFFSVREQLRAVITRPLAAKVLPSLKIPEYKPLQNEFEKRLAADPSTTDLVENLNAWTAVYKDILRRMNKYGKDEVVTELIKHFEEKLQEIEKLKIRARS